MMKSMFVLTALLLSPLIIVGGATGSESDSMMNSSSSSSSSTSSSSNAHHEFEPLITVRSETEKFDIRRNLIQFDKEKLEFDRQARMERQEKRRERARQKIASIKPDLSQMHRLTKEELQQATEEDHPWVRRTSWSGSSTDPYEYVGLADPTQEYDKWQQAYRMLGGFIDCDHDISEQDHHSNENDNDSQAKDGACSRWMMWAAYIDPNYQGGGYDEYFGDNPVGSLDCHSHDSDWQLIGVYRQEFYQYVEQISKHLWAIDEYDYVVALAGLSYMTKIPCFYVGQSSDGDYIYAGVAPQAYGKWTMALYTDDYCITPNEDLGLTYDDFGLTTYPSLNKDADDGGYGDDVYSWWTGTQEYTLTQLNDVYESYKYCTSCVDYPTYQDGYFIGDYGTDDDDLINQCWKFYSHDSFVCEADCIALGHAQGTILHVEYSGVSWGESLSAFSSSSSSSSNASASAAGESRWSRLLANVFVTFAFIVFIATFLAFAVARRSRHRERASGRSRRLVDDGDGVFRSSRSKSRSKSQSRSKSRSRRESSSRKSSTYEPPSTRSKSTRSKSTSRRHIDDF